jgi:hypothetical protein
MAASHREPHDAAGGSSREIRSALFVRMVLLAVSITVAIPCADAQTIGDLEALEKAPGLRMYSLVNV